MQSARGEPDELRRTVVNGGRRHEPQSRVPVRVVVVVDLLASWLNRDMFCLRQLSLMRRANIHPVGRSFEALRVLKPLAIRSLVP